MSPPLQSIYLALLLAAAILLSTLLATSGMGRDGIHIDRAGALDLGVLRLGCQASARAPRYGDPPRAPYRQPHFIERERVPFALALIISF